MFKSSIFLESGILHPVTSLSVILLEQDELWPRGTGSNPQLSDFPWKFQVRVTHA
jgi:hypothetical protein